MLMNEKVIRFSKWDTDILGIKYYILNSNTKKLNISNILIKLPKNSLTFTRVDFNNISIINKLLLNNFYIADILLEFKYIVKDIKVQKEIIKNTYTLDSKSIYKKECIKLIRKEFQIGRIHEDKHLGIKKGKKLYKEWCKNNFININTIGYIEDTKVKGFIQFSQDKNTIRIIFIVINSKYQNQGIGTKLIKYIKKYAYDKKCLKIIVGTQLNNMKAINFYEKNDFLQKKSLVGLHYVK
jgi:ribosomal protein S18 acetylase RimI-like enzyme